MICVSLGFTSIAECLTSLEKVDFAEIRLDLMDIDASDIPALFSMGKRLIATCRPGKHNAEIRQELLMECIHHGAAFIDIEHDAEEKYRISILKEAKKAGTQVILSYHNHEQTPSSPELEGLIRRGFGLGADYFKIACRTHSSSDAARLLGLLGDPKMKGRLIVVGMGQSGQAVRIIAPFFGSPFTYAAYAPGMETAEGQLSLETLTRLYDRLKGILRD
jgi:3-dehydroquinate dehydratase type I